MCTGIGQRGIGQTLNELKIILLVNGHDDENHYEVMKRERAAHHQSQVADLGIMG
jgi:hypothetical protein